MLVFLVLSLIVLVVLFTIWLYVSTVHFKKSINIGEKYYVGNQRYTLNPQLKFRNNTQKVYILNSDYLLKMTELVQKVQTLLQSVGIEGRISGGTLLGFERHGSVIPWDDDLDMHVDVSHRAYMYSSNFENQALNSNLQCIYLLGANHRNATKEGAAVRIRVLGSTTPVCDIFFTENRTDTQCVSKIDSWRNSKPVYSSVENWAYDEIYPAQAKTYGTIELTVPCKPRAVLMTQYGQKCMQECVSRSFLFSHNTPFSLFDFFWRKKNK